MFQNFIGLDFHIAGSHVTGIALAEARFERLAVLGKRSVVRGHDILQITIEEINASVAFERANVVVA